MEHPSAHRKAGVIAALLAAIVFVSASIPARAGQNDDVYSNDVRLGMYAVFYHTDATNLSGPFVPPGVNFYAQNLVTLYAAYVRRLSSHFDAELALGWPPVTSTVGRGPSRLGSVPYDGMVISTARWIAPTLLLQYKFLSENSPLRPYIGVGVNYTTFYDRDSTAAGDAISGGPTKISLTSSVGPAANVGVVYSIAPRWHVYASYSWSRVNSTLTANTAGTIRTSNVRFGPQSLVISVGYGF